MSCAACSIGKTLAVLLYLCQLNFKPPVFDAHTFRLYGLRDRIRVIEVTSSPASYWSELAPPSTSTPVSEQRVLRLDSLGSSRVTGPGRLERMSEAEQSSDLRQPEIFNQDEVVREMSSMAEIEQSAREKLWKDSVWCHSSSNEFNGGGPPLTTAGPPVNGGRR
ncbi:hypothetical protein Tco_0451932 [Tanacetum coccineum]